VVDWWIGGLVDRWVGDCEQNLIIRVQHELSFFHMRLQQLIDVAAEHLAGVVRHRRRQIQRCHDGHVVDDDCFAGLGELAITARFGGDIDDHGPRAHRAHHRLGDQSRRGLARDLRRRDHEIDILDVIGDHGERSRLLVRALLAGVAAGRLAPGRRQLSGDESGAKTLDLLANCRAHVER